VGDEHNVVCAGFPPTFPTKVEFQENTLGWMRSREEQLRHRGFILLQLVRWFTKSRATVAMLCKNTVIRNLVAATKDQALPIGNLRSFAFDAAKEFGVAADASLVVADITNELGAKTCALTGLREEIMPRVFGWAGKNLCRM